MTTADVGHGAAGGQLVADSIQRRDPIRQLGPVTGPEEPLGAGEQARVVVAPAERTIAPERVADLGDVHEQRTERVHGAGNERGRLVIGEDHRLLGRDLVAVGVGIP